MSNEDTLSMRALYTQIQLPGYKKKNEDEQAYEDTIKQSENLLNQNFLTIQQQVGELAATVNALEKWASQLK